MFELRCCREYCVICHCKTQLCDCAAFKMLTDPQRTCYCVEYDDCTAPIFYLGDIWTIYMLCKTLPMLFGKAVNEWMSFLCGTRHRPEHPNVPVRKRRSYCIVLGDHRIRYPVLVHLLDTCGLVRVLSKDIVHVSVDGGKKTKFVFVGFTKDANTKRYTRTKYVAPADHSLDSDLMKRLDLIQQGYDPRPIGRQRYKLTPRCGEYQGSRKRYLCFG